MRLKRLIGFALLGMMLALPWHGIEAGGWASVEIVDGPDHLEAGKPVTLDLSIKQHGITPIDIDPLVITATNTESGESIESTATKAPGTGNYTVELTFPAEGVWTMLGTPGGFPSFEMATVKVGLMTGDASILAPAGSIVVHLTGGMGSGQFDPARIEIASGTLVIWQNDSVEGHTVVLDGDASRSGLIAPGAAFAMRFDEPGTYRVSCGPHPAMTATIVVR